MGQPQPSIAEVDFDWLGDRVIGHYWTNQHPVRQSLCTRPRHCFGVLRRAAPGQVITAS
jgi:hypothetical protein